MLPACNPAHDVFDFDEWAKLAASSPEAFERRRQEWLNLLISDSNDARRLRGLQCRIDLERMRARTAMGSCLRLSSLMWDSLFACRDLLNELNNDQNVAPTATALPPAQDAQIINFRPRH